MTEETKENPVVPWKLQRRFVRFEAQLRENGKPVAAVVLEVKTREGDDFSTPEFRAAVEQQSAVVLRNLFKLELELMPDGWEPGAMVLPRASVLVDVRGRRL